MKAHHEHEFEAALGLPEKLPEGERILWQATPVWQQLAWHAFHVRKIAAYFALMWALQIAHYWEQGAAINVMFKQCGTSLLLACVALGLLSLSAYYAAQTAMYTLTNRRVVMRVGIVLSLTFNLPLKKIVAADVAQGQQGFGDLALSLNTQDRIAWLNLWPHARAWHVKQPQPTLRCVANVAEVAALLASAWQQENSHIVWHQNMPASGQSSQNTHGVMA